MKLVKITALLLTIIVLICSVACANDKNNDDIANETTQQSISGNETENNQTEETTVPEAVKDDLGERNFNGATYTILNRKSTVDESFSDALSGDIVGDAVYDRNLAVSERFNVKIGVIEEPGEWDNRETFMSKVSSSYLAGSHDYSAILTHSAYIVNVGINGYGYDFNALEDIDLSKNWWCPSYTNNVTINGSVYSALGDISYNLYRYMHCIFINKKIAEDAGITDYYQVVKDGKWTLDKMKEYAFKVSSDLDGNGTYDDNDLYGLGMNGHGNRIFATVFDTQITTLDTATGRQKINIPNEKYIEVYDKLFDLSKNHKEVLYTHNCESQDDIFAKGTLMMYVGRFGNAELFKDMDEDFGIIPLPKYDEKQENYISGTRDYTSALAIMGNIENPEMVGTVTEALCMYGYNMVTPAYYETALKLKYLNDETGMEMLDIIRDTLTMDFAMTYTNNTGLLFSIMGDNINNGVANITSLLKGQAKSSAKLLDKLYESYDKLGK